MVLSTRSTTAHIAAEFVFIYDSCLPIQAVSSMPGGSTEQVSDEMPRTNPETLIQSSRKAAARTGEAVTGVVKTAGRFVGWVVVKTMGSFFGDDVETSDPVLTSRDRELNGWTES